MATISHDAPRILSIGAGRTGMHVASWWWPGEARIIVVDRYSSRTGQPQPAVDNIAAGTTGQR